MCLQNFVEQFYNDNKVFFFFSLNKRFKLFLISTNLAFDSQEYLTHKTAARFIFLLALNILKPPHGVLGLP